jgi:uncharacterized membrane protein
MTIVFKCPNCKGICAFDDEFAGRRARCTRCQQLFIIPKSGGDKVLKVKPKFVDRGPLPGFYEAVFVKSLGIFKNRKVIWPILLVLFCTYLQFFCGHIRLTVQVYIPAIQDVVDLIIPAGFFIEVIAWSGLAWIYMETIYLTAFDVDALPDRFEGSKKQFLGAMVVSVYTFFITVFFSQLLLIAGLLVMEIMNIESKLLVFLLAVPGLIVFPVMLLNVAVSKDLWTVFRIDYAIKPMVKAPEAYVFLFLFFTVITALLIYLPDAGKLSQATAGAWKYGLYFTAAFFTNILGLWAMRSAGLFCRHYGGYFPW